MELKNARTGLIMIIIAELSGVGSTLYTQRTWINDTLIGVINQIVILGYIVGIIGAHLASKDIKFFSAVRNVFILLIIETTAEFLIDYLGFVSDYQPISFLHMLFDAVTMLFVLKGIEYMYRSVNYSLKLHRTTVLLVLITAVINFVDSLWSQTVTLITDTEGKLFRIIILLVFMVLTMVAYVFYLIVIGKAIGLCRNYDKAQVIREKV